MFSEATYAVIGHVVVTSIIFLGWMRMTVWALKHVLVWQRHRRLRRDLDLR